MAELTILIGVVGGAVLIAVLIRMGSTSGQVEDLKLRLRALERQVGELSKKDLGQRAQPKSSPVAPVKTAQEDRPKSVEPSLEPKFSGPRPVSETVPQPPPLPKVAAKAQTPCPKKSAPQPKPSKTFSISEFLRGIGLWPPEREEGSAELVLMQWWAPRIAGLLAILALIFFAVYVANTPLVKY